jgi:hypothetical protein
MFCCTDLAALEQPMAATMRVINSLSRRRTVLETGHWAALNPDYVLVAEPSTSLEVSAVALRLLVRLMTAAFEASCRDSATSQTSLQVWIIQ